MELEDFTLELSSSFDDEEDYQTAVESSPDSNLSSNYSKSPIFNSKRRIDYRKKRKLIDINSKQSPTPDTKQSQACVAKSIKNYYENVQDLLNEFNDSDNDEDIVCDSLMQIQESQSPSGALQEDFDRNETQKENTSERSNSQISTSSLSFQNNFVTYLSSTQHSNNNYTVFNNEENLANISAFVDETQEMSNHIIVSDEGLHVDKNNKSPNNYEYVNIDMSLESDDIEIFKSLPSDYTLDMNDTLREDTSLKYAINNTSNIEEIILPGTDINNMSQEDTCLSLTNQLDNTAENTLSSSDENNSFLDKCYSSINPLDNIEGSIFSSSDISNSFEENTCTSLLDQLNNIEENTLSNSNKNNNVQKDLYSSLTNPSNYIEDNVLLNSNLNNSLQGGTCMSFTNPENDIQENRLSCSDVSNSLQEKTCTALINPLNNTEDNVLSSEESDMQFHSFRHYKKRALSSSDISSSDVRNSDVSSSNESSSEERHSDQSDKFSYTSKLRKKKKINYKNLNMGLDRNYISKQQSKEKLKKVLINIGISLHHYNDFWQNCEHNVEEILKRIISLRNKFSKQSLPFWRYSHLLKEEFEAYQDLLNLDTKNILSNKERLTRSKIFRKKLILRKKVLNKFKKIRFCHPVTTIQPTPSISKKKSIDYATIKAKLANVIDEESD